VWRHAHGSVLVLPMSGHDVMHLTGAGDDLWQLLAEPLTVDEVASRLAEIYDRSPEEIIQDIAPVLDDLVARGVVDLVNSV
jgi:hypothetical protein